MYLPFRELTCCCEVFQALVVSKNFKPLDTSKHSVLFMKALDDGEEFLVMDLIVVLCRCIML